MTWLNGMLFGPVVYVCPPRPMVKNFNDGRTPGMIFADAWMSNFWFRVVSANLMKGVSKKELTCR
ncbi:hypothetical protein D3C84_1135800 [compost metagenome]